MLCYEYSFNIFVWWNVFFCYFVTWNICKSFNTTKCLNSLATPLLKTSFSIFMVDRLHLSLLNIWSDCNIFFTKNFCTINTVISFLWKVDNLFYLGSSNGSFVILKLGSMFDWIWFLWHHSLSINTCLDINQQIHS